MRKIILTVTCLIVFISSGWAQLPNSNGNFWLEKIGAKYTQYSGKGMKITGQKGEFIYNNNGVYIQFVKSINRFSKKIMSYRIGGLYFINDDQAIEDSKKFGINAKGYAGDLPFDLKFGMTSNEFEQKYPNTQIDSKGQIYFMEYLPGFTDLHVMAKFTSGKLSVVQLIWRSAWDISKSFQYSVDLPYYDLDKSNHDRLISRKHLRRQPVFDYLRKAIDSWQNGTPINGHPGAKKSFEQEGKITSVFCINNLNFKYSFYQRLESVLSLFLEECIVNKEHKNYKVFDDYQRAHNYNDYNSRSGEEFFYHKEDTEYLKRNSWPVFHIYTVAENNEVIMNLILPKLSDDKSDRFRKEKYSICIAENEKPVRSRQHYIKSSGLDMSANVKSELKGVRGSEILSAIGRPVEGALVQNIIKGYGEFTFHPLLKDYGTMDFKGITIGYSIDSIFKDLRIVSSITFEKEQLTRTPFNLKKGMSLKKVRKLFGADLFRDPEYAAVIENYKGCRLSFRYDDKDRLESLGIQLPEEGFR